VSRIAPWARATLLPWVRLPSNWIEQGGLKAFGWEQKIGSDNTAALMLLAVIAHHSDISLGRAQLTWDELCAKAHLSRAKVSAGLNLLCDRNLIARSPEGRSTFQIVNFSDEHRWAMLPARGMYSGESVTAFRSFHLRMRAELDALKIYFLLAARRDRNTNMTMLGYEGIEAYSGVGRNFIRGALSVLAANGMVHITNRPSMLDPHGVASIYRLVHLEPRRHSGTTGRASESIDMS